MEAKTFKGPYFYIIYRMQSAHYFYRAFNHVNYEDPDINVAIPVFSIHGNHDDPSGVRQSLRATIHFRAHIG